MSTNPPKYFISFVEEAVLNPAYKDYIAGRMEIFDEYHAYAIEEVRFLTKKRETFWEFAEKWDFKDVSKEELASIKDTIKKEFLDA